MDHDHGQPEHRPTLHSVTPPPSDRATWRPWREPLTWKRPILVRRGGCGVPGPRDPEAC